MRKQETIEEFRDRTLPYYRKLAQSVQEEERAKRVIGEEKRIRKQLVVLSNVLAIYESSYKQLKKTVDIKNEEIEELKEKVKRFEKYLDGVDRN